jgi:hypothetical protein
LAGPGLGQIRGFLRRIGLAPDSQWGWHEHAKIGGSSKVERNFVMDASKMKIVYVISERGGKNYWNRCGVAFVNSDGSLNVKLESFPVSGELHVRDYVPREDGVLPTLAKTRNNGQKKVEQVAEL